ncbi:hypothetical protein [Facilibium subflavum]|uniref:hypothetical protein n=1 Tax=Facilibium subflavum TaxID=2219058 RepID=UPI000E65E315|nr:hypothetical protein [Facilibium subflavum]
MVNISQNYVKMLTSLEKMQGFFYSMRFLGVVLFTLFVYLLVGSYFLPNIEPDFGKGIFHHLLFLPRLIQENPIISALAVVVLVAYLILRIRRFLRQQ